MAKAKYKQGKDGWFSTLAWDGTYNADGSKHRKQLRTKKSSKELERMVMELRNKVESRQITVSTDMTFCEYAKHWLEVYKAQKELNTRNMYKNIITVHFRQLTGIKLTDIRRIHLQAENKLLKVRLWISISRLRTWRIYSQASNSRNRQKRKNGC